MSEPTEPEFFNCTVVSEEVVNCNGTLYDLPERRLTPEDSEFWIYIGVYLALVLAAGVMSGLTMGLLSMDTTTLTVITESGTRSEQRYAKRILPLVKRHHLLLVTLLLANAAAVEAMPIFLDKVSSPVIAIVTSVTAVLIFGEVIPQALCTRYGLAIGAFFSPLVYLLMGLFIIIAWPLAKLLDCMLGEEHGTFYRRGQLKVLVDLHGPNGPNGEQPGGLTRSGSVHGDGKDEHLSIDEVLIIKGALDMTNKTARNAMLPISKVYMISADEKMDDGVMTQMLTVGHSRIPVYDGNRSNVVAVLLTKTLIKLVPQDCRLVRDIIHISNYSRPPMFVDEDTPLYDLLNMFQTGKSHLAMVRKSIPQEAMASGDAATAMSDKQPLLKIEDETYSEEVPDVVGIITLEDVMEQLLQEEIEDEIDVLRASREVGKLLKVTMAKVANYQKRQMHRCLSQPQTAPRSPDGLSPSVGLQLSSSQPDESRMPAHPHGDDPAQMRMQGSQPDVSKDASQRQVSFAESDDRPLVTFD